MNKFINKLFKSKTVKFKDKANFKEFVLDKEIQKIFEAFNSYSNEVELRFVGGCVRKLIIDEKVDDIDLSINLKPEDVIKVLKKNSINFYESGIDHGTITAIINKKNFEITSLRKDINTDGRHAEVQFTENWLEDASRRDFTINAIYSDIDGNLYDPFNGKKDLYDGLIKFIGDPTTRIREDYLRILRYIRFYLGYSKNKHDKNTVKIIKQNLIGLKNVSRNRQLQELKKITYIKNFYKINSNILSRELFGLIFPELKYINRIDKLDNLSIEILKQKNFDFILSLLLIDKSEDTDYFLYKYNLSNKEKDKISFLYSIFSEEPKKGFFTKENLSKIIIKHGKENLIDVLDYKILTTRKNRNDFLDLKKYFIDFKIPVLPIKANDLIERFDLKEGKLLGSILREIEEKWLENNFNISKNQIEDIVKSKHI